MPANRIAVVVVLLALACAKSASSTGGGGGGGNGEPSLTASCTPPAVTAGQGATTCTAVLTNSTAAISWTLDGPGALSSSAGASVEYQPPTTLSSAAVAHVVATAADLTAPVDVSIAASVGGLTVQGRAVDPLGFPLADVHVSVAGLPSTTTAADGTFTVPGVVAPYDLVLFTLGKGRTVTVYAGLTRPDPTVAIYQDGLTGAGAAARSATVTGTVTAGDANPGGDYQGVLVASAQLPAIDMPFAWGGGVSAPPSSWTWAPSWFGAATLGSSVLAIQWHVDPSMAAPTAYWMGTADVTLTDGETASVPPIALSSTPAITTQGTIDLPAHYALDQISAQLAPAAGGPAFPLFWDTNGGATTFTYVLPAMGQGELRLCARASSTDPAHDDDVALGCVDAAGLATVDLPVPAAPRPYAPAKGANAVGMDTTFSWQPLAGGVHALEVRPEDDAPAYLVFTAAARTALPTVGPAELLLPSGAAYTWRVRGFAPVASVDALAAPGAVPLALDDPSPLPGPWSWGRSGAYEFTVR